MVLAQGADLEASRSLIGLPDEVSGGIGRHRPPASFFILLVAAQASRAWLGLVCAQVWVGEQSSNGNTVFEVKPGTVGAAGGCL